MNTGQVFVGQTHCDPPYQNFGQVIAHPAHAAVPPWATHTQRNTLPILQLHNHCRLCVWRLL